MKILLAPENPAGVATALRDGLRARGHDAQLVTFAAHPFGWEHDRLAPTYRARLREALRRYDVCHYQFGTTLAEFAEAPFARLALMHYWGDDARTTDVARRLGSPRAGLPRDDRTVLRRLRLAGRTCRAALVSDLELAAYVEPHFRRVYLVPTPLCPVPAARPAPGHDPPLVLHAPSEQRVKGTAEIVAVLETLAARGVLRYRLVSGVPRAEVLQAIGDADAVVDQLNSETPGVLTAESMALARPVLTQFRPDRLAPFAQGLPAVPVTPETLGAELERVCADVALRRTLGEAGVAYAQLYDRARVAAAVEHVYAHAPDAAPGVYSASPDGITAT